MAVTHGYATEGEFTSFCRGVEGQDEEKRADALEDACRLIDLDCGRTFWKETTASARLYTPPLSDPVLFVDDFWTTTDLVIVDNGTTLTAADYQLEPVNGVGPDGSTGWPYYRIRKFTGWAYPSYPGEASVSVTAQWGWAAVPNPVRRAALLEGKWNLDNEEVRLGVAGFGQFGDIRVRSGTVTSRLIASFRRADRAPGFGFA